MSVLSMVNITFSFHYRWTPNVLKFFVKKCETFFLLDYLHGLDAHVFLTSIPRALPNQDAEPPYLSKILH